VRGLDHVNLALEKYLVLTVFRRREQGADGGMDTFCRGEHLA